MCSILSSLLARSPCFAATAPDAEIAVTAIPTATSASQRNGRDRQCSISPLPLNSLAVGASLSRANRVVHAPLVAEHVADLTDSGVGGERLPHYRQEVRLPPRRLAHGLERARSLI